MDARNNLLSCINKGVYERMPTFIFDTSFGMSVLGRPVSDLYSNGFDPELSARSISAGRRYLGHDGMVGATSCGDTRVFGADVRYYSDRPPMVVRNAFSDPMRLYTNSPADMDLITKKLIRSNYLLREKEPDAFIAGCIPSPFLLAAVLRGLESLMMDLGSGNGYILDLLDFSQTIVQDMNDLMCYDGSCDAILIPGAYDNVDLIGMDALRRYCINDLRTIKETADEYDMPTIFHPHGSFTEGQGIEALDEFISIGFGCIYYGENNDHRRMVELTKDSCALMGGVDTSTTIFVGPDERVIQDTADVLEQVDDRRFIFTCSCSVDANLNGERLKTMLDTVRHHGDGGPGRN